MTLFFCPSGPLLRYRSGIFQIQDLNPEANRVWRMSKWELFKLGCMCLYAVVRA